MDKYTKANLDRWNELAEFNYQSRFYNVSEFIAGSTSLDEIAKKELGDLKGKKVLHLQCHFGMDSLSMVRLGASVVGVDFSPEAIKKANILKERLQKTEDDVRFIEANVMELNLVDEALLEPNSFDIVFTSHGVLTWLNSLESWGESIYRFLKPGGFFLLIDMHPFAYTFDETYTEGIKLGYSYFHSDVPDSFDETSSYSDLDGTAKFKHLREYNWTHNISYIIDCLLRQGLVLGYLHEFPFISWRFLPKLEKKADGYWHFPDAYQGPIAPLMFSLKAGKPKPT